MKSTARAVVIGGGVVGASTLFHLAKIGWSDVLLLEKSELTSGSTWHAAGGMHTFNGEANISRLQKYTIDLYREIEAMSGQSCGLHANGGLMLAATQGELDSLKLICSRARYLGMETAMISLDEAQQLQSADRSQLFHRRAVARRRRPLRSVRHHAGLRQGRAHARRLGGTRATQPPPAPTPLRPRWSIPRATPIPLAAPSSSSQRCSTSSAVPAAAASPPWVRLTPRPCP